MPKALKGRQPKALKTIGRGKSKVSIYEEQNTFEDKKCGVTRTYVRYTVIHRVGRKQFKNRFSDLERATEEAHQTHTSLVNGQTNAAEFTDTDRHSLNESVKELANLPADIRPSLIDAVKEFTQARIKLPFDQTISGVVTDYLHLLSKLPDGVSPATAVEDYMERRRQIDHDITVPDAIERFVRTRESLKRSRDHIRDIEARLTRFGEALPIPVSQLTAAMVQRYLDDRDVGARSKKNEFAHIRSLLRWAVKHKHAAREILDDIKAVELPEPELGETLIFSPAELEELLEATRTLRPDLIPALVICAFCGLRSAEIRRLDWKEVKLERGHIEVTAGKAKTRSRRLVPICEAGREWLAPYAKTEGQVCPVLGENRLYEALTASVNRRRTARKVKARFKWKRNALRHSFCSYRLAETQNMNQVAMEAGNSPNMIDRHYRELVDPADADRWFGLRPPAEYNVVALPVAAAA